MPKPGEFYDLLLDYAAAPAAVRSVCIGLVWTYCEADDMGLAMSPGIATRTLPWAGTLCGRQLNELAGWVREYDPHRSVVGTAAVNAGINGLRMLPDGISLQAEPGADNNLAVFQHFLPRLAGKRIAVVGRYPGLDRFAEANRLEITVLERQPTGADLPDTACEYVLPDAEWVFITASSIANKTFPRLAELAKNAVTVLMGPTTPWLPDLYHFGIDYLAGIEVADSDALRRTVAEGGGVRLFDEAVRYRVAPIGIEPSKEWSRRMIAQAAATRESLRIDMETWYERRPDKRFPAYAALEMVTQRLSRLDTCFKRLWDEKPDVNPAFSRTSGTASAG